ncbi:MAG: MarR family transcriptional regulator [Candidatus Thorarchaeota archaeon]|nr:MarR family transcriptional regulator [Candidatus Thorarchaeota archaeon]
MMTPNDLPKSALLILDHLAIHGPMAPRDLSRESKIPLRTVTFALQKLIRQKLLRKVPNLMDMRKQVYHADIERIHELQNEIERLRALVGVSLRVI